MSASARKGSARKSPAYCLISPVADRYAMPIINCTRTDQDRGRDDALEIRADDLVDAVMATQQAPRRQGPAHAYEPKQYQRHHYPKQDAIRDRRSPSPFDSDQHTPPYGDGEDHNACDRAGDHTRRQVRRAIARANQDRGEQAGAGPRSDPEDVQRAHQALRHSQRVDADEPEEDAEKHAEDQAEDHSPGPKVMPEPRPKQGSETGRPNTQCFPAEPVLQVGRQVGSRGVPFLRRAPGISGRPPPAPDRRRG